MKAFILLICSIYAQSTSTMKACYSQDAKANVYFCAPKTGISTVPVSKTDPGVTSGYCCQNKATDANCLHGDVVECTLNKALMDLPLY